MGNSKAQVSAEYGVNLAISRQLSAISQAIEKDSRQLAVSSNTFRSIAQSVNSKQKAAGSKQQLGRYELCALRLTDCFFAQHLTLSLLLPAAYLSVFLFFLSANCQLPTVFLKIFVCSL